MLMGCAKHESMVGRRPVLAGADGVPVSERGVGIVYFLPVAGGAEAKTEGSGDWKDW